MEYLIINPSIIVYETKASFVVRPQKHLVLCEFAYVLKRGSKLIEQKGFVVNNSLTMYERNNIKSITGISSEIARTSGKNIEDCLKLIFDLLCTNFDKLYIVDFKLLMTFLSGIKNKYTICQNIFTIIDNLQKQKKIHFDCNIQNKTNIAITDCINIAKLI